jgi:hypothetical protein
MSLFVASSHISLPNRFIESNLIAPKEIRTALVVFALMPVSRAISSLFANRWAVAQGLDGLDEIGEVPWELPPAMTDSSGHDFESRQISGQLLVNAVTAEVGTGI